MKAGQYITFNLELWNGNHWETKEYSKRVIHVDNKPKCTDQPKCIVEVLGEEYGIYFEDIKEVTPANGEQLTLVL